MKQVRKDDPVSRSPNRSGQARPEIRCLNTLRGLAALIVLVSHFSNAALGFGKSWMGTGAGQLGVMLFFILSGFLMSLLYWDKPESLRNMFIFTVSRVARVAPLFLAVILVSFVFDWPYRLADHKVFLSHLFLLSGKSILWTIPAEIQFYLLFAMAWYFLKRRPAILLAVLSLGYAALFATHFSVHTFEVFGLQVSTNIVKALPYFIAGGLLGLCYKKTGGPLRSANHAFVLGLALIPMLFPLAFFDLFGSHHGLWKDMGVLLVVTLSFCSIVFMVPSGNMLMENPIGDFYGKISYSMYLLHLPVLRYIMDKDLDLNNWLLFATFLAMSTLVAYISYLLIENPARKFLRSAIRPRRHKGNAQS